MKRETISYFIRGKDVSKHLPMLMTRVNDPEYCYFVIRQEHVTPGQGACNKLVLLAQHLEAQFFLEILVTEPSNSDIAHAIRTGRVGYEDRLNVRVSFLSEHRAYVDRLLMILFHDLALVEEVPETD